MKLTSSAALVSVLAGQGHHVSSLRGASARGRNLQDDPRQVKSTKTEWPECIGSQAADCARIVRREAKRHEIKDLTVKVVVPRTKEEILGTYMKVGIAVNALGQVTGDKNDGMISYPFIWVSAEEGKTRELGPWDCSGDDPWTCCRKIRVSVRDMDIHGNHIECFAHENELVPDVRTDRPVYEEENLAYLTFVYNGENEQYEQMIVPPTQVLEIRAQKNVTIVEEISSLDSLLGDTIVDTSGDEVTAPLPDGAAPVEAVTINDLLQLEADLMEATDNIGDAQNLIGAIEKEIEAVTMGVDISSILDPQTPAEVEQAAILGATEIPLMTADETTPEAPPKATSLSDILRAVRGKMYDYATNNLVVEKYIWIYASHSGKVWVAPQIGGVFNGHEESLKDIPGYEDHKLRYVSNLTKTDEGARYLKWAEVDV
jgi:hypothetical protein